MTLTVESVGSGSTIQDGGRRGWLRFGVTPAGPMDWVARETANRALGNPPDAAAIEIGAGGLSLVANERMPVAYAGGGFAWSLDDVRLPAAARVTLAAGARLRARAGAWGAFAVCAVRGGVEVAPVMGSRSTHTRSGLGGLDGRALQAGDTVGACRSSEGENPDDSTIGAPWLARSDAPIRVVLGPQDDYFSPATIEAFFAAPYRLTSAADRMAYKFDGPPLSHARDFNIVSDGVALGAIQVAGDGRPLVLMADRQPTGGYAKIAHVCRADIGRLAQMRQGESVRFAPIEPEAARKALLALEDEVSRTLNWLAPLRRLPTTASLFGANLISGVIDGPSGGGTL